MESEQPFGDEMPNFDICGTVFKDLFEDIDVLDAKTETAALSEFENSGRKSTENGLVLKHGTPEYRNAGTPEY